MMRRLLLVLVALGMVSVWGLTPGLADAGITGGSFSDVPRSHPAYSAVQNLLSRGILVPTTSGQFMGDQPLLRYDAAVWLDRAIKNIEAKISASTDLTPRISTLENQVRSLSSDVSKLSSDLSTLSARVNALQQSVGQGGEVAQKAQLGVVLGLTGVILGLAALAWLIFF
ncbi:MAG: S-layer homology domain-containing protein [Candidatus Bipolaricaulota bacterium]|nr:S-layer homology domain-containing protein [Candidatus Bipolaricaulota bacterium]MDW8127176.1 S-layer homology domain-containing protein [Candidatus Bipolaricaulota bacterium]